MASGTSSDINALTRDVANLTTEFKSANQQKDKLLGNGTSAFGSGGSGNRLSNSLASFSSGLSGTGPIGKILGGGAQLASAYINYASMAMPSVTDTMNRSAAFYRSAITSPGMSYGQLSNATFNAMRGGISSPGSDQVVANTLTGMGVFASTNANSTYMQMTRETANAAKYLGMDNGSASAAIVGMTSGQTSANLQASLGMYTSDPMTGKPRTMAQNFSNIADVLTAGQQKMSASEVMSNYYQGNLGASLNNMGLSQDQQQMFLQFMINRSNGKNMDLSSNAQTKKLMAGMTNPSSPTLDLNTTMTSQMQTAQASYLDGMQKAADMFKNMNPEVENLIKKYGSLNAQLQTYLATPIGNAQVTNATNATKGTAGILGGLWDILAPLLGVKVGMSLATSGAGTAATAGADVVATAGADMAATAGAGLAATAAVAAPVAATGLSILSLSGDTQQAARKPSTYNPKHAPLPGLPGGAPLKPKGGKASGNKLASTSGATTAKSSAAPGHSHVPANGPITATLHEMGPLWGAAGHNGTDYGVNDGSPVYAVADGVVSTDSVGSGSYSYGHYITLDHGNGYKTLYAHLDPSSADVHPGDVVSSGQVIGKSGHSGHVSGPHLHFEVQKDGVSVDPSAMLSGAVATNIDAKSGKAKNSTGTTDTTTTSASLFSVSMSGVSLIQSSAAQLLGAATATTDGPVASWTGTGSSPSTSALSSQVGAMGNGGKMSGNALGGSTISGSSVAATTSKIEINLNIAQASADEARKFAAYVKQILESDAQTASMGAY